MNIIKRKPGVIVLPVLAVFIIFIILLFMLVGQKQNTNALLLEYRASEIVNLIADLYAQGNVPDPSELDEDILGLGIYDHNGTMVYQYGSAPERLGGNRMRRNDVRINKNRSIEIMRSGGDFDERVIPGFQQRFRDMKEQAGRNQRVSPILKKYQTGIYLEYSNSSYLAERRLIILIIVLFVLSFAFLSVLIYNLYNSNKKLTVKSEHDKQLIQLGEAARTLAHEIRNPLGTLKIQRDLLKKKLPEGYEGNLETIDRELKRLNTLVERVGDFLRNPVGHRQRIELSEYISSLYGERNDISLTDFAAMPEICFDTERLRTVLDNIINNAVDAGGEADIRLDVSGNFLQVSVSDSGPGIPDEVISRIFDPFFTTKDRGTGLGLAVVRQLMDAAGGWVRIDNVNPGTCVGLGFRIADGGEA